MCSGLCKPNLVFSSYDFIYWFSVSSELRTSITYCVLSTCLSLLCILIYVLFISNIEHLCNTESFVAIFSHWALETSLCSLRSVVAWSFCARWVYERAETGAGLETRWTREPDTRLAPRGHRQVPHGGLAAPTEHPYWTGLGQHRKVLGMETKRALHWTRGGDEASTTPIRLQGCSTTQGNLPRLLLDRTRHHHQASFRSVSARLQVSRAAASHHQALALLRSGQLVPQGWTPSTPGEHCRTQVPTSAGSGDLLPKLGEETAPPLVQDQRAASRRSWQRYKVLVIVETKPLWCSVFRTSFPFRFWRPSPPPSFSEHSSTVATTTTATGSSLQLPSLPWRLLTMVMPTTTRLWQFLTGESPLANWVVSLLAACTLKQVKTGHLICPKIPEALKSGALPSTDLANLLVLAP